MAEKIVIAQLDLDVDALIKSTSDVKKVIDQLKEAQKNLAKQGDTNSEQFVQNVADLKVLNSAYNSNLKAISDSVNAKAEETNRTALLSLALQAEATSIKEAREQNSLLNKLRNETNVTTEEGKKELEALNKKLDENNAFIKENADQYLQQKINIGNYSESIKEAFQDLNIFNGGLSGFIGRAQQAGGVLPLLSNGLKAVTTGIVGMTRAALTFLATPIGAVIGAIGLALGLVINYLKSTQGGIDAVTSVTRPLQAIFQSLIGVFQKVGKALFDAFSNPKQVLTDLADFVKQNLINRFTAFGKILDGILTLDFAKIGDGVLQAGTGVENLTGKIKDGAKATGEFLDEAVKKGQEIDRLTKEAEIAQLAYNRAQIKTNDLIDEQLLISKDTSKTFAERAKASEEIIRLTEELSKAEEAIIQKKIQALKIQQSLNDTTREGNQELIDLEVQLDEAQDRGLNARLEQTRVLSGLKKEQQAEAVEQAKAEADRQQKILDDAVSISKAQLDLFLSEQGIKSKSLEEGLKLAEQIAQKQIAINQKVFDASKKTEADKLALQTANNEARNTLLQAQADAVIANVDRELQIFKDANKTQLDDKKFLTEELANEEINRLNRIAEEEAEAQTQRLINGQITEAQYQDAIKAIDEKFYQDKLAIEQQRKVAEAERKLIDLENEKIARELEFQNNFANRQQELEAGLKQELEAAEKSGADKNKIKQKYQALQKKLDGDLKDFEMQQYREIADLTMGIFKENTVAFKAAATAKVLLDTIEKFNVAKNTGLALAANPLTASLAPNAFLQAGLIAAGGALQIGKIAGVKFEKGGTMEVGGNRHAQGGTKFVGSDGTRFEAEKGELIGVLNRNASSAFMSFNDAFGSKGKVGTTYAQTGGIIARGMDSGVADLQQLAVLTADAVSQIPAPIVTVEDINTVGNRVNVIESGANF
jgi:hypothetical protein